MTELPVPGYFDPSRVGEVWRVPYEERAREAEVWAREYGIAPAADDTLRVCLVAVDVQNTFCLPGFELFVGGRSGTGAVDDNRRLCEFIYRNLGAVTQIVPTLDTHSPLQIFHAVFLVDDEGRHPAPYTLVSADDVARGVWKANPAVARALGVGEEYLQEHVRHYTRTLQAGGKYDLTIWPYHALLGGIGHALVPSVEEAIFFHSIAREVAPDFQVKGSNPLTEHYSMLGPEVTEDHQGKQLGAKNQPLIDKLLEYDAVLIAGQAKSHCVAWTIDDLLTGIAVRDRSLAEKVYLLEDCSSPVVVPGVVDYTDEADAAFERFSAEGMHVVRSTEPLSSWLEAQPARA
jgi:nicotinamidase-related amidase